jgi:hypothetical protein
LPHLIYAALFTPALSVAVRLYDRTGMILAAPVAITLVTTSIYALIGGARRRFRRVLPPALLAGVTTAALPTLAGACAKQALLFAHVAPKIWLILAATLLVSVFAASWVFGLFLAFLTWRGIEHTQAFTALDHPGYKHFLRLRVRSDGKGVDGYCIGLTDPLAEDARAELVDTFSWRLGS